MMAQLPATKSTDTPTFKSNAFDGKHTWSFVTHNTLPNIDNNKPKKNIILGPVTGQQHLSLVHSGCTQYVPKQVNKHPNTIHDIQ